MCKFVVLRPQAWLDNFKMELKSTAFIWFNFESVSAICRLRYALESLACQQTKFPSCHSSLQYPLQNWADCLALLWLHDRKCLPRKVSKTSKVSKYPTVKVSLVNLHMQHHPANLFKNNVTITFDEFYKNSSRFYFTFPQNKCEHDPNRWCKVCHYFCQKDAHIDELQHAHQPNVFDWN